MATITPALIHINLWDIIKGSWPWTFGVLKFTFLLIGWKTWVLIVIVLVIGGLAYRKRNRR